MNAKEWRKIHIKRACEDLGITERDYRRFLIIGNKLHRIFENQCNGYQDANGNWDQSAADREEMIEDSLKVKAAAMADKLGLHIFFQGDPRGATIYLDKDIIPYDNYTSATCIY